MHHLPLRRAFALAALLALLDACSTSDATDAAVNADATATTHADVAVNADAARLDARTPDADPMGAHDAGVVDASPPDTGVPDSGFADAAAPDATVCVPRDGGPGVAFTDPPMLLSGTGLYTNTASKTLSPDARRFAPSHVLWSDGAVKTRWVVLPDCATIDTTDMDHWVLPVGTKFFKEFAVDGLRIETRMIARVGPGPDDFVYAAYAWDDQERDAVLTPAGLRDARGTPHDIPARADCLTCHGHLPERALGFSAVQLSHSGTVAGVNIGDLSREGRLTVPAPQGFVAPGDPTTARVLGYLHANCGNCHHAGPNAIHFNNPFVLRLSVHDARPEDTGVYRTAIGVPVEMFNYPGITHRILAGTSTASCVPFRMGERGNLRQMPPIATEVIDPTFLPIVRRWIDDL